MPGELRLRVTLLDPLPGVVHALQLGPTATREFSPPVRSSARELVFECSVRVGPSAEGSAVRFLGPAVHGPTSDRFLYINSGKQAAQRDTPWDRRLKVRLAGITPALVKAALAKPNLALEATLPGRGKDGGPSCATVAFISGWALERAKSK